MKKLLFVLLTITALSCSKKITVDAMVINANIYTVNENFDKAEAFATQQGKIIAVGTTAEIEEKYTSTQVINAEGKTIVPGLIDAHCHFFGLGLQQQKVDLTGTKSFDEVIQKIVDFQKEKNVSYITGRGWDQNDWEVKEFPSKDKLDELFPDTPIAITRIDGHALLANQAAIDLAGVTIKTPFSGGDIHQKNGKLTGIFIDNPMDLIESKIPTPSKAAQIQALKDAEKISFSYGLTTVDDAGLPREAIELIDSLHQTGDLKIRIYAMVSNTPKDVDYYLNKGIIKTDRLNVRSIKVYGDGALGSRGAAMKEPYYDKHNHFGAILATPEEYMNVAKQIAASEYQMNSHAIGDSANYLMLKTYKDVLTNQKDRRWRIEHAQILDPEDFKYFDNILPSVQPTHATSDMYWAEDRVGPKRIKTSYAYKDLLNKYGKIALGTDFPVEKVSPFLTFYASVARKDLNNYPENGFQMENALTREETLKGMTIWAAFSNFEEQEKGSIEVGKFADFIILDKNIMEVDDAKIPYIKAVETYVNGDRVN
ncbi:MAG: amidohydrolase [Lutibacter sp.]|uniref:amidohydrolase n=1 Tax=Lutibacter sp. TaxID=1925666 RepID=UPI001845C1E6|nr:amidohydrolase [Lutibacter sp.]MBT8318254.1 amidohydrolase [Lutibacter sp.]NNJ59113.1 amidohydrolase [Lutibacter sp.]